MDVTGNASTVFLLSSVCLFFLLVFIKLVNELWWTPIRVQRALRRQGIKGPSYKFLHGNTKEIVKMRKESMSRPMDLSHNTFPRLQPHLYSWLKLYGRNFVTWHGPRPDLVITEVEFVKEIMNRGQTYPKREANVFEKRIFGDGLVQSKGKKWAKQRKLANHTFHAESLRSMTPAMIASVKMMLERWKEHDGKEIEVFEEFKILTSDVISRTAFGSCYVEGKDIFDNLGKLVFLLARNDFKVKIPGLSPYYKSNDEIEAEKLEQGIHDSILRIMEKREETSTMSGEVGNFGTDFLGALMKAKNIADGKNRITVQDVVDECKTFNVAGQETTTNLLAWVVFLLGIHTDWQEKARQEVLQLFGQNNPNSDGIAKLKTMNMIINETLRLYPPAIVLRRKLKEETKLGNFILPPNIQFLIPILPLHHNKETWGDDAYLFNPERFSQGVAKATNNNPAMYLPFGLGPRNCVGNNFATNEVKIAMSLILQRYSFTLSPCYIHSPVQIVTVRAQHGVQVMLHHL